MTAGASNNTRKRVLIVDDDQDFSAAIGEILDSEGYEVRLTHNVADAMAVVRDYDAHVALLDIRLGRENGIDLISQLQQIRSDILCVMMTGHAALETAIQALQQGAYNYLRKPVDGTDLLATLERCFETIVLKEDKQDAESRLSVRNRELEAFTVRLRSIVESVRRLTASSALEQLLPLLLREVAGDIGADQGHLFLHRDGKLPLAHALHATDSLDAEKATISALTVNTLTEMKKPLLVPDSSVTPHVVLDDWRPDESVSMLMLPLFGENDVVLAVVVLYREIEHPFSERDGELASLLASVCSEILRSAEATAAVAAGERRYRLLANNVADIIWTVDMDGNPTYISPSVQAMRGFSVDAAMAQSLEEHMAGESAASVRQLLARARDSKGAFEKLPPANLELEMRHCDGSFVTTESSFTVLTDETGRTVGLLGVSRDISERKRAEDAQSRLAAAVAHAAESIMITDPEGTIQYVNPAFEKVTGYGPAEVIGSTPRILKSGKHDSAFYEKLWETLKQGHVWTGRFVNKTKDGRATEEEATISAIRDNRDNMIGFVSVARDVTHEVELEHKLRQAQKMEAIGTLAGGIAHDFNNMLSPILGYAELAMSDVEPGSELYQSLSEISGAGKRASELVQQILSFSRRSEHERKPIRISTILKEALRLLRGSLPSTISIHRDFANCAPVLADPTEIHQVVVNLCTNAYHAMREKGGTLTVSLCQVDITERLPEAVRDLPEGEYIKLSISDSGHGMDAETQDRIFEPYFTTKRVGEGTGLGLATVHGIVESHQGRIVVDSQLNKGTTFSIYLPAAPASATAEIEGVVEGNSTRGSERIMVVDDEPSIVSMLKRGLGTLGYSVDGFSSSRAALEAFTNAPHDYDLLITDQTMPRLTGLELARRVIAIRPDFPVILATGFSETVNEQIAHKAGIREFLFKPTSPNAIAEIARRILDDVSARE